MEFVESMNDRWFRAPRRPLLSIFGIAALTALGACGSTAKAQSPATKPAPTTHTLTGVLQFGAPYGCVYNNDPFGLEGGQPITVTNQQGTTIGAATLGSTPTLNPANGICPYHFTVTNLPNATFYSISVGTENPVTESLSQLEADGWHVILTMKTPPP